MLNTPFQIFTLIRIHRCLTSCFRFSELQVLGYYIRNNIDSKKLVEEIKSIASNPADKYYFNVSAEEALLEIAGTLGDRIFNIEGEKNVSVKARLKI